MSCADLHAIMRTQLYLHLQEAIESGDEASEAKIRKAIGLAASLRVYLDGLTLLPT